MSSFSSIKTLAEENAIRAIHQGRPVAAREWTDADGMLHVEIALADRDGVWVREGNIDRKDRTGAVLYRVRRMIVRRCKHHPTHVRADLLDGDFHDGPGGDQAVEYCHTCGAFRRVFDVYGGKPRYGDWQW